MTLLPIIEREFRAECRRPVSYYLRLTAACALIIVLVDTLKLQGHYSAARLGGVLFERLSMWLMVTILVFVPAMTADCISREKREGTLGLLFLTPLAPEDILLAKSLSSGLRALVMVFAAVPVLGICLLFGGVSWLQVLVAVAMNFSALVVAIASGVSASARHVDWFRAVAAEELRCFAIIILVGLWTFIVAASTSGFNNPILLMGAMMVGVWMLSYIAIGTAAYSLKEQWQKENEVLPSSVTRQFARSDFLKRVFRWNKAVTLDRNPIAWLQEYSWAARLTKWAWLAVIVAAEVVVLLVSFTAVFTGIQTFVSVVAAVGMAFTAAASFRPERQSGALEILLVTPLRPWQIIWGRIWGLWCHFFPAVAIIIFVWIFVPLYSVRRIEWYYVIPVVATYLTLPIVGLYISLLRFNQLMAWVATMLVSLLGPYWLAQQLVPHGFGYDRRPMIVATVVVLQLILGGVATHLLHRNMADRTFALAA